MHVVSIFFAAALIVGSIASVQTRQQAIFRAALAIRGSWMLAEYGDQKVRGQALIMRGEPLELEIGIVNPFAGPRAGAERDWLLKASLTVARGELFDTNRSVIGSLDCMVNPLPVRNENAVSSETVVILGNAGEQFFACRFDTGTLPAGPYTIEARWSAANGTDELRNDYESLVPTFVPFELREVRSLEDGLDRDIHLALRALRLELPADAENLTTQMLSREPSSISALILRSRARQATGRCRDAQRDVQLAADLIETGGDKRHKQHPRLSDVNRRTTATDWRKMARELKCR